MTGSFKQRVARVCEDEKQKGEHLCNFVNIPCGRI